MWCGVESHRVCVELLPETLEHTSTSPKSEDASVLTITAAVMLRGPLGSSRHVWIYLAKKRRRELILFWRSF